MGTCYTINNRMLLFQRWIQTVSKKPMTCLNTQHLDKVAAEVRCNYISIENEIAVCEKMTDGIILEKVTKKSNP